MEHLKEKVVEIARNTHNRSGGSCGDYLKEVSHELKITVGELIEIINDTKQVELRIGIHGKMLKLKTR